MSSFDPKLISWFKEQQDAQKVSDLARRLAQAERNAGTAAANVYTELAGDLATVSGQVATLELTALQIVGSTTYEADVGVQYLTWGGGFATATSVFSHNLGKTPTLALVTALSQAGTGPIAVLLASPPTSSTLTVYGCTVPVGTDPGYVPSGGTSVPVGYMVIG